MAKRKKKKKMPVPLIIVLCVCVVALGVSIWQLSDIFLEYKAGTDEYEDLQQYVMAEIPEDGETPAAEDAAEEGEDGVEEERVQRVALSELQAQNPDTVGWIEIPGTGISYPLMQADDDAYYLNHTFSNKVNSAGSIFVEALNSPDFTDLHTIIYGHNMKNGSMFAGLKNYRNESYFENHPYIYIDLEDGSHCYQIFSCHEAPVTDVSYTIGYAADDVYASFLDEIKASSLYDTGVDVGTGDSVITLSTCTSNDANRFVVHAKKIY